jgi:hypothetical protein
VTITGPASVPQPSVVAEQPANGRFTVQFLPQIAGVYNVTVLRCGSACWVLFTALTVTPSVRSFGTTPTQQSPVSLTVVAGSLDRAQTTVTGLPGVAVAGQRFAYILTPRCGPAPLGRRPAGLAHAARAATCMGTWSTTLSPLHSFRRR